VWLRMRKLLVQKFLSVHEQRYTDIWPGWCWWHLFFNYFYYSDKLHENRNGTMVSCGNLDNLCHWLLASFDLCISFDVKGLIFRAEIIHTQLVHKLANIMHLFWKLKWDWWRCSIPLELCTVGEKVFCFFYVEFYSSYFLI